MAEAAALVRSHRGDHDGALERADEATGIIENTDYLRGRGTSTRSAGSSSPTPAVATRRGAFEESMSRYERKGVVPAVARIRTRLAALGVELTLLSERAGRGGSASG